MNLNASKQGFISLILRHFLCIKIKTKKCKKISKLLLTIYFCNDILIFVASDKVAIEPWQINNNATLKILQRIVQREHDSENYQPKSSKKGKN